jgi:IS1 family transposase
MNPVPGLTHEWYRKVNPVKVIALLCEGTGIRACERLTGLNRRTVLAILATAGEKCARLLDDKIRNIQVEQVQADELACFVKTKDYNTLPNDDQHGAFYTYLAVDRASKLIINWHTSKRTRQSTEPFLLDLHGRVKAGFQLSTDGYKSYCGHNGAVKQVFGNTINYGTEIKRYLADKNRLANLYIPHHFFTKRVLSVSKKKRIGNPDLDTVTTCHCERTNLSVRIFTRRFTRCTLGYSKKLENLKHAIALFVAHFNFCRVHSAHNQTPAQAAGITDKVFSIKDLLANAPV